MTRHGPPPHPPAPEVPATAPGIALLAHRLLDIGKRNRLISTPLGKRRAKQLDIEDERADEVFRHLARDNRAMSFEPRPEGAEAEAVNSPSGSRPLVPGDPQLGLSGAGPLVPGDPQYGLAIPVPDDPPAPRGLAAHHTDSKLRTRLTPEALQKRLLAIHREARTLEEEQGVSVLFMAIGFLGWFESESSDVERYAPLLLVPVDLARTAVRASFGLRFREQDIEPNLSLAAMLEADFGIALPDLPEGDEWLPSEYYRAVEAAVAGKPRWRVLRDTMELSFFSFGKFLMHRDLTADVDWGEGRGPSDHPVLGRLLAGGEARAPVLSSDERLDRRFPDPRELGHVMDADASQTQVIAAAGEGRNLVVQGPPGTGKSQTITNIVAVAVRQGKRVLFVAEKRAALDVVHERLRRCGLGPLCLELHSSKASKPNVYGELARTLALGPPQPVDEAAFERLREVRDDLNRMSGLMHAVDETTGSTPYGIVGALSYWSQEAEPPDFGIEGAAEWSRDEWNERLRATEALAALTADEGPESAHAWRGATRRLTEMDRRRLAGHVAEATARLDELERELERAVRLAGLQAAGTLAPSRRAARHAPWVADHLDALAAMPEAVAEALESRALADLLRLRRRTDLLDASLELAQDIADAQALRGKVLAGVDRAALDADWTGVALTLRSRGRSLFRWLSGEYRSAVARLRSVALKGLPRAPGDRLRIAESLVDLGRRREALAGRDALGTDLFGSLWRQWDTDVGRLLPALRWLADQVALLACEENASLMDVKRQLDAVEGFRRAGVRSRRADGRASPPLPAAPDGDAAHELRRASAALREAAESRARTWGEVAADVGLEDETAFGAAADGVPLADLGERLAQWGASLGGLDGWHRLRTAAERASELGLEPLRERLADGALATDTAAATLHLVRGEAVWRRMVRERPELGELDGADRTASVERFRHLDRDLQRLASVEVAARHFQGLPTGASGQIGIVRGEIGKKRRHIPIRKLLDRAGEAVARIKPVFLMSPLSVAQYLAPGQLRFDLVLIDEASQMRPEDAAGAILRADQMVVVGDQKQLPPSSFFDREVMGADQSDESEDESALMAAQIAEMESILSLCEARALAGGMLRWHYRSRHPSLIQVSNHEFYESRLVFPPSPDAAGRDSGLTFRHVADGCYDRGGRRNNLREAEAVAEAALAHARERPDQTLGVVAMSVAQRDTILDRMEWMRAEHPELDGFCRGGRREPFFVKNLENVQGDERDAIFVSIGYGPDAGGYMAQSFGPVSGEGGERRLNVLFTRARSRCTIFASIRHGDIRVDAAKRPGPRVLKRFLKYAETGEMDLPAPTGAEMDSPFEMSVARTLQRHGHRVAAQVGSAGFRIDLAVHDPDDPGRYLLAIECDGARYHSSSWARERDRLRQAVLEGKGWRFHRIWSTDWFYNREVEENKLLDAIDRARRAGPGGGQGRAGRDGMAAGGGGPRRAGQGERRLRSSVELAVERVERGSAGGGGRSNRDGAGSAPSDVVPRLAPLPPPDLNGAPYRAADLDIPERTHHKLEDVRSEHLARHVERIVHAEGPVHVDEVIRRLSRAWGYARAGSRIQAAVRGAIESAVRQGLVRPSGEPSRTGRSSRGGSVGERSAGEPRSDGRARDGRTQEATDTPRSQFLERPDADAAPQVRDRRNLPAVSRKLEMLPPTEVREAIRQVVEGSVSVPVAQCAVDVARMMGYMRTPNGFPELVARAAKALVAEGRLAEVDGELRLAARSARLGAEASDS